jgi:hypothetical protein
MPRDLAFLQEIDTLCSHNRFYRTVEERDDALTGTFASFKTNPNIVAGHVARFV